MSLRNRCHFDGRLDPKGQGYLTQRILRFLCIGVIVVTLGTSSGCSPSALIGGAIAGSVLYAHMNKDNFPSRRRKVVPTVYRPRVYATPGSANRTYTASSPPVQKAEPKPNGRPVAASPVIEGALAYRELRWKDAVRILNRAIDAGNCTGSELGQAHILLGAIAYQQGDAEVARRHFVVAHRHDAQLQPSSQLFPPPLIDFYRATGKPP